MNTRVILFLLSTFVMSAPAYAAIVITIEEQGSDVVASYSGSIDLTGIDSRIVGTSNTQMIRPEQPQAYFLDNDTFRMSSTMFDHNPWTVAPSTFGPGPGVGIATADSFSIEDGNGFGFIDNGFLFPSDYTSRSPISGSMTFNDKTLATMGINVGTMNATFSSGDTLTLTAIPEPNSYGFLLGAAGLATAIFFRRRRRSSAV